MDIPKADDTLPENPIPEGYTFEDKLEAIISCMLERLQREAMEPQESAIFNVMVYELVDILFEQVERVSNGMPLKVTSSRLTGLVSLIQSFIREEEVKYGNIVVSHTEI
jgi:hypothetical protein